MATTAKNHPANAVPRIPVRWRTLMRLLGGGFLLLLSVLFIISLPTRFAELTHICEEEICPALWLTPNSASALNDIGLSVEFYAFYQTGVEVFAVGLCAVLCMFIFYAHSHTWMGLMTAIVVLAAPIFVLNSVWTFIQVYQQYAILIEFVQDITIIALFGFMHLFPTGRFVPSWTRWNLLLISIWQFVTFVHIGNPLEQYAREWYGVGFIILGIFGCVMIGAMVYRYRRILTVGQKQQVKWVLLAIFITVLGAADWLIFFEFYRPTGGQSALLNNLVHLPFAIATQVALPIAITIASLRYRLWDVDIILNRTLVYTLLTAVIALIYVILVNLVGIVMDTSLPGTLLATAVIAVSFQSLRDRIQRAINRFMFGQRDEPQRVLVHLSKQLQTAILPQEILETSVNTIASSLKLPFVAIVIHRGANQLMRTEYGANNTPTQSFPLIYQHEAVGELVAGQRSPGEPLNHADQGVLEGIAQQLGAIVFAVRLQADLQVARERLVITREEERRRLRRDLHDGLGPTLASLPLKIDAAIDLIEQDQQTTVRYLGDVKRQAQGLVADLRQVVHGLRPPALDELGLAAALHSALIQLKTHPNGLKITFTANNLPEQLPAAVEAATYRITMEAVTNVVKHAQAQHCWITLQFVAHPPAMHINIEDDGVGIPSAIVPNVGLLSMRERAEELGGSFQFQPRLPSGTHITVSLPLSETSALP